MLKKYLYTHQFLTSLPILFFIIFLHPLYGVQLFEKSGGLLIIFKVLTVVVTLAGCAGIVWYIQTFWKNATKKQLAKPSMWYLLPLNIVSMIIMGKFLIGIILGLY